MEVGFERLLLILATADTSITPTSATMCQGSLGSLLSLTSTFMMSAFGITIAGRTGRLRVTASRVISILVFRITLYNSLPARAKTMASRRRFPEGGCAMERYMMRMKRPKPASAMATDVAVEISAGP